VSRSALPYVVDVREADFPTSVLAQSNSVPVVVDMWASWCGPCQQLTPILEKLAGEFDGRFLLARIDVDAEQRIAQAFQVQSIPTVYAIIAGQPVPLFQGALAEHQVREYLEQTLNVAAESGVTGRLPQPDGMIRPIRLGESRGPAASASATSAPTTSAASTPPQESAVLPEALKLFVSHASEDSVAATDIVSELDRCGMATWLATRDIQVGENYAAQIYNAIVDSSHLVVLLSPASVASQHVQREMNLALDQGKSVLPLIVSSNSDFMSSLPAEWKYWLGVVQVVPYTGPSEAVSTLVKRLSTVK